MLVDIFSSFLSLPLSLTEIFIDKGLSFCVKFAYIPPAVFLYFQLPLLLFFFFLFLPFSPVLMPYLLQVCVEI
jgi:hypothetical protein